MVVSVDSRWVFFFSQEEDWPLLLSLVVFPTMIQLILLPWFPESPRYLLIEKENTHATIAGWKLNLWKHLHWCLPTSPVDVSLFGSHEYLRSPTSLCAFALTALKWYRNKGDIQAEVEEMQEELRSLSSIQTVSVCGLLMDRCVRWQLITIAVVNIGMQLSGIDAVSVNKVFSPFSVCKQRLCSSNESARPYDYIPSVVLHFSAPPSSSIHHCPWCNPWVAKQGSSRTTLHYLLVLSVSVTQLEAVHLSAHRVEHISTCSMWMGAPCVPIHMLISFPSRGLPPPAELDCPSCFTWKHFGF